MVDLLMVLIALETGLVGWRGMEWMLWMMRVSR